MVPVAVTTLQPPVRVTVYVMAAPATVGVPLMVTTLPAHVPVTPVGRLLTVAPVAPVVAYVIGAIGVLMHTVCASVPAPEVLDIVLLAFTAMVPVVEIAPQPPVRVTVYVMAAPATVGVPLMVTTLPAHVPVTPVGRLLTVAPVAPVVAYVIGAIGVLMHTVCAFVPAAEVSVTVLLGFHRDGPGGRDGSAPAGQGDRVRLGRTRHRRRPADGHHVPRPCPGHAGG